MADLPALPDLAKRQLQLRWKRLLIRYHLTGVHYRWADQQLERELERERDRRLRLAIKTPGSAAQILMETTSLGIHASCAVADSHLQNLSNEYWELWLCSGASHELFGSWLAELKRQVLADVASV